MTKLEDNYLIRDCQDMLILGSEDAPNGHAAITQYVKNRSALESQVPHHRLYAEFIEPDAEKMTTDKFVPMRTFDLAEAWPDYAGTHDISDTELARIASSSANVAEADEIWENKDWWTDENND